MKSWKFTAEGFTAEGTAVVREPTGTGRRSPEGNARGDERGQAMTSLQEKLHLALLRRFLRSTLDTG